MRYLLAILGLLIVPLLPGRWQERWPWPTPASLEAMAHVSAYLHTLASFGLWAWGMVAYVGSYSEKVTDIVANDTGDAGYITWLGPVMYLSYLFTPLGALLTLYMADSAVRVIHALSTGGPMGSLFVCLPVWLIEKLEGARRRDRLRAKYGPASQPDRIKPVGDGLLVCCNRPHPEWHALLTYSFGGKLFILHSHGEGMAEGRACFEYRLRPWPDNQMVRSIMVLDPPADRDARRG